MKVITLLAVIFALAQGWSLGVSPVQAECVVVYFSLYDPVYDPPCDGINPASIVSIRVTTSPTPISAGSCSSFALDNLYANVELYDQDGCGNGKPVVCSIVASSSSLSGYYPVTVIGGGCFSVCETCTP